MNMIEPKLKQWSRRSFFGKMARLGMAVGAAGFLGSALETVTSIPALACVSSVDCGYPCRGPCYCCSPHGFTQSSCGYQDSCCNDWICTAYLNCGDFYQCIEAVGHANGVCTFAFCA
jgi:hypothetical protein